MCLIVFAWKTRADYPLIVLAHRDEFIARPTAPMARWPGTNIIAGRDLQAGGSWLGVSAANRFAAVTNVRQAGVPPGTLSRGELVARFLQGEEDIADFAQAAADNQLYGGFNLLLMANRGAEAELWYCSNRFGFRPLMPGIYGLSNATLDSPWPKLMKTRQRFLHKLDSGDAPESSWLDLLRDSSPASDADLPDTGIGLDKERWLSPPLIVSPHYGSVSASLVTQRADGYWQMFERQHDARSGSIIGTRAFDSDSPGPCLE